MELRRLMDIGTTSPRRVGFAVMAPSERPLLSATRTPVAGQYASPRPSWWDRRRRPGCVEADPHLAIDALVGPASPAAADPRLAGPDPHRHTYGGARANHAEAHLRSREGRADARSDRRLLLVDGASVFDSLRCLNAAVRPVRVVHEHVHPSIRVSRWRRTLGRAGEGAVADT